MQKATFKIHRAKSHYDQLVIQDGSKDCVILTKEGNSLFVDIYGDLRLISSMMVENNQVQRVKTI